MTSKQHRFVIYLWLAALTGAVIALVSAVKCNAQTYRVEFPTQCGPGWCCPGGSCQPQYYYQQPRQQQQGPQPDGEFTPSVGSQGTPCFPSLPAPPPPTTPGITPAPCPPQPTIDWAAWQKQQADLIAAQAKQTEALHSLVVTIQNQINIQNNATPTPPQAVITPAAPATKPFYIRVRNPKSGAVTEYAPVNQGQYVTIDMAPAATPAR